MATEIQHFTCQNQKKIRVVTIDDTVRHASAFDVASAMEKAAKQSWSRYSSSVGGGVRYHKMNQSRETPVLTAHQVLKFVKNFPNGPIVDLFRSTDLQSLVLFLDPELAYDMAVPDHDSNDENEGQENDESDTQIPADNLTTVTSSRRITRGLDASSIYVRVRLPDRYLLQDLPVNVREISQDIIKFGIARHLYSRHSTYQGDNGYFMFAYNVSSREEASLIESILRFSYKDITIPGTYEYLDAKQLAEKLGFDDYDETNYAHYEDLGRRLFSKIVKLIHYLWPRHRQYSTSFGTHITILDAATQSFMTRTGTITRPTMREPKFHQYNLEYDQAMELGFVCDEIAVPNSASVQITELKDEVLKLHKIIDELKAENIKVRSDYHDLLHNKRGVVMLTENNEEAEAPTPTQEQVQDVPVPVPAPPPATTQVSEPLVQRARSNGAIIGRDIITGVETRYDSAEAVSRYLNISPHAFRRTVLNQARQVSGKHWRTPSMPYWQPPNGFVFNSTVFQKSLRYIRGTNEQGQSRIYENPNMAADTLEFNVNTLRNHIDKGSRFKGFVWTTLSKSEEGTWHMPNDPPPLNAPFEIVQASTNDGADGRNLGKVIERDLVTGEEVVYENYTAAANKHDVTRQIMKDRFIGQCRHINGKTFRWSSAKLFWNPPAHFKYPTDQGFQKQYGSHVFVQSENEDGTDPRLYESIKIASILEDTPVWKINESVQRGRVHDGRKWVHATEDQYKIFSPVVREPVDIQIN